MAKQMNDEQRLAALEAYDPASKLVQIQTKQGLKDYYPAAWRLYELNLRYPNANFSSKITFIDVERDIVIVRARLYLGTDYDVSEKRAEAHKSGPIAQLDKVETAAKARAARDFGVGTEYALEMEAEDVVDGESPARSRREARRTPAPRPTPEKPVDTFAPMKQAAKSLGLASNGAEWTAWKKSVLGDEVLDSKLTQEHVARLREAIEVARRNKSAA